MELQSEIPAHWTESERWAWKQIANGDIADFDISQADNLNPTTSDGWSASRRIRAAVLRSILTQREFTSVIPSSGVRLKGVLVDDETLDLQHQRLDFQFWLDRSRILVDLSFNDVAIAGALSLEESCVRGRFTLQRARISAAVNLSRGIFAGPVDWNGASISGMVAIRDGTKFDGTVDFTGIRLGSVLDMSGVVCKGRFMLGLASVDGFVNFGPAARFSEAVDIEGCSVGQFLDMRGTVFDGPVSLAGSSIGSVALLSDDACFNAPLNLVMLRVGANLRLDGSVFAQDVDATTIFVGGNLNLGPEAQFSGKVDFRGAEISRNLGITKSIFHGNLELEEARIDGSLIYRDQSTFWSRLLLRRAKIAGTLDLLGVIANGPVDARNVTVGEAVFARNCRFESDVDMAYATVGSTVDLGGSTFRKALKLNSAGIGSALFLRGGATFNWEVNLHAIRVGSNLELQGSTFHGSVDLTAGLVKDELVLGDHRALTAEWGDSANLNLRNSRVGCLQSWWVDDTSNSWPTTYWLEGFTYDGLTPIDFRSAEASGERETETLSQWLDAGWGSSQQPYLHLAAILKSEGEPSGSADILYAARERRRKSAWANSDSLGKAKSRDWITAFGLGILKVTVGYGLGLRYFKVLYWIAGFGAIGALALYCSGATQPTHWLQPVFASFDQLLPVVTLDAAHDELIFADYQPYWLRTFFYSLKIVGWVLGSFIVAGLAGLTQSDR